MSKPIVTPGDRIRRLRESKALSLEEVARMCGDIEVDGKKEKVRVLTASGLSRVETGAVMWPHPKTRRAIAWALGEDPGRIWRPGERA